MNKTTISIKGMHCRSCEILIEEKVKEIPGVKYLNISYKKAEAEIFSSSPIDQQQIQEKIEEAGYEVGSDQKAWISQDPKEYQDLFLSLIILGLLYFIAKQLGLANFKVGSGNPSSLIVVLVVGLTAGISTCMALVGGLVLGISARHAEKHPEATPAQKFRPHLFFNLGRILSYVLLGGIIGMVGKAFQLSGTTLGVLTILVGIVMLLLGIQLTEIFPRISANSFTLPAGLAKLLGIKKHHDKEYSHANSMLVGALTFFLPCGFTQAMQLYAMSTGNFVSGALIMGVFALGTAPGLLGVGGLTALIKGTFARKFFKFAGLLVVFLALFNISNGLNLTGWNKISFNTPKSNQTTNDPNVKIENGVQVVRMVQVSNGYKPNKFTIQKDIPVKWIIDSKDAGSCASSIYAPKIDVRKLLKPGENVIEFTPSQTGRIPFSCSMGMYGGAFDVVEKTSDSPKPETGNNSRTPAKNQDQEITADTQIVKASYTYKGDLEPKSFTVKAGLPVRYEIDVKEDGYGCMASVAIPGLSEDYEVFKKGEPIVFSFTPKNPGNYQVTCAMGTPRVRITVI